MGERPDFHPDDIDSDNLLPADEVRPLKSNNPLESPLFKRFVHQARTRLGATLGLRRLNNQDNRKE